MPDQEWDLDFLNLYFWHNKQTHRAFELGGLGTVVPGYGQNRCPACGKVIGYGREVGLEVAGIYQGARFLCPKPCVDLENREAYEFQKAVSDRR